jgi:CheY-like chemotaxis protein
MLIPIPMRPGSPYLVLSESKYEFSSLPQEDTPSAKTSQLKRVLVVDDERRIADSVSEILQQNGYSAAAVYSGDDAIEHARTLCPDVVICDVLMPRKNGVETAIAISKLCAQCRIILFSGQSQTADILKQASAAGHNFELLPKPIHPGELLRSLQS